MITRELFLILGGDAQCLQQTERIKDTLIN